MSSCLMFTVLYTIASIISSTIYGFGPGSLTAETGRVELTGSSLLLGRETKDGTVNTAVTA